MKTLVIYFSKTGTTAGVAQTIEDRLAADTYEIKEAVPYTSADLNWNVPIRSKAMRLVVLLMRGLCQTCQPTIRC